MNRVGLRLTVRGTAHEIRFADLGPKEARWVRSATGFSLRRLINLEEADLDSLCALYWLARRKAGEQWLKYVDAEEAFPSYATFDADVALEAIEEDGDEDVEVDDETPLPSGD